MSGNFEFGSLAAATWSIYRQCLKGAWRACTVNWWLAFVPVGSFVIFQAAAFLVAPLFGRHLGGFVLGLLLALFLAHYLSVVEEAVSGGKASLRATLENAKLLFAPVIGILFTLFILNLAADMLLIRDGAEQIKIGLNILLLLAFNPLPEATYQTRSPFSLALFSNSLDFMKENGIEWLVPMIVCCLPLALLFPEGFLAALGSTNPLSIGYLFFSSANAAQLYLGYWGAALAIVISVWVSFYLMVFRGLLFARLGNSTRRKRIYQYRFE